MYNSYLTAFVCAADCGSFNKAAERLYMSPPSVMKQINALEKHLELKLFDRTNQGLRLTPAGQVIYRHARFLFDYSAKAVEEARQQTHVSETTFCIGSSLLNPCKPFMDIWYKVNREFPGYKLHIVPFEDNHKGILSEISSLGEKYDFLVAACDSMDWLELCNFHKLGAYRLCCAVAREHHLSRKDHLTIKDLFGETVMMVRRGDSAVNDAVRTSLELHTEIRIEDTAPFYDIEVFNRCAQMQYILLTLECWNDVHPGLVTLPVEWDHSIPYGILYSKNASNDILRLLSLINQSLI